MRRSLYSPQDPFDGFFRNPDSSILPSRRLLEAAKIRRLIKSLGRASCNDIYTYQQALDGKSGSRVRLSGHPFLMISSYDYLGLIGHPAIERAAMEAISEFGTSSAGVRLLTGTTKIHRLLEKDIAQFKGTEAAMTFSSGYLANVAVVSALLGPGDRIIVDSKSHQSIVEACRLSRVPMFRFDHNLPSSLEAELAKKPSGRRTLVIIEGIYSMDGDIGRLPEIIELKKKFGAYLMVDEAHSFGVLGARGRGLDEHFHIQPGDVDIWMGSLSKAIPSNGGFLAGRKELVFYLQHAAAPYIFSSALCPAAVAAAREALHVIDAERGRLTALWRNASLLRERMTEMGYNTGHSESPVVPIILGDDDKALRLARSLFARGILATPVVKPAVSPGGARIRLCATAAQDESFLGEVFDGFRRTARTAFS